MAKGRVPGQLVELWQAAKLPLTLIGTWVVFTLCVALATTSRSDRASSLLLLVGFAALLAPLAYALAVNVSRNGPSNQPRRLFWWLLFLGVFVACFLYTLVGDSTGRLTSATILVIVIGLVLANRLGRS